MNNKKKIAYLIDFGLSSFYINLSTKKHRPFGFRKIFGSKFSSINGNLGYELSRRDDIESCIYVLIYLWKPDIFDLNIRAKTKYQRKACYIRFKEDIDKLCLGFPEEFSIILKYIRSLEFEARPNYLKIKNAFYSLCTKLKINSNYLFEWEL